MKEDPNFRATDITQPPHQLASPVFTRHVLTGEVYVSGSAVVVGPGYALTAAHVIEDHLEHFGLDLRCGESNFEMLMYLTENGGDGYLPLKIHRMVVGAPHDIALLLLSVPTDWPSDYVWKIPPIQLLPPSEGENIFAFGFAGPKVTHVAGDIPEIDLSARTSTGTVVKVYHDLRDRSRNPFPCYEVNARFDGSMSGGPVFNASGSLCGIVCSSLPADEEYPEHSSYVSTLWPMLGLSMHEGAPFSDYFDAGVLHAIDRNEVVVTSFVDGTRQVSIKRPRSISGV